MRSLSNTPVKLLSAILLSLVSINVFAQVDSAGILDDVLNAYAGQAGGWVVDITDAASWLFWLLVSISMIFTFGFMAIRKADIGEFFAEFLRFIIFTGFFWWLLQNGPNFSLDIINSLRQVGSVAAGLPNALSPSGIVDIGFDIMGRVFAISSVWEPIDSAVAIVIGAIIVVVLALVGINMLLLLISGWFLAFAGIFFLGFGGSKWTSEIAINYYKTVLGLAAQIMAMILLVGIGQNIITQYQNDLSGQLELIELMVILIVAITLLLLTNKVPALLAGVISGASVGGQGIGNFGAGAAIGGAAALATAGAAAAAGVAAVAAQTAGGGSAIMAAFKEAQNSIGSSNGGSGDNHIESSVNSANAGSQDYNNGNTEGESSLSSVMGGSGESESGSITDGSSSGDGEVASTDTGSVSSPNSAASSDSSASPQSSEPFPSNNSAETSSSGNSPAETSQPNNSPSEDVTSSEHQGNKQQSSAGGVAKAAAIAGHMAKSLGAGAKEHFTNKMAENMDKAKERVAQTTGGQIAEEIRNPNAKAQARDDAKTVAQAEKEIASNELSQKAAEARGDVDIPSSDEISSFINKTNEE